MSERFPGYDVTDKRHSPSWDRATRAVVDRRLAVPREPRFFSRDEWSVLEAICDRIIPQPGERAPVPLPAYVDQKLHEGRQDGYRIAPLPPQDEAWRRGIAALDAEARAAHGRRFPELGTDDQDALLRAMQEGRLTGEAWGGMPCKLFFNERLLNDIVRAYYAHPAAWSEIGFGGPASPRGYVRMSLDRRDPWEAAEARPGEEAQAERENRRVGRS